MGFSKFEHVKISAIAGVVPEKVINIDDEIEFYNNDPKLLERNKKILGLGTRHVADDGVSNTDMCEAAILKLINDNNIDKNNIDAIVVSSTSLDYKYPATSCILHGRLDLSETCSCFDITGISCSSYVYSLWNIFSLIESKAIKNCILVNGDIASRHTNVENRNIAILLGDAAVATYLEFDEENNFSYFLTGSRGKDWKNLIAPAGGSLLPIKEDIVNLKITNDRGDVWHLWEDIMQGFEVFKYTAEIGPWGIKNLLNYSGKTIDDIEFFVNHQANKQIVNTIMKHAGVPKEKYSTDTFRKYANCGGVSIATNVCDVLKDEKVKDVLFSSFGTGLSYAFAIINLSKIKNSGISVYIPTEPPLTRQEQIDYWIKYYKGEVQ